MFKRTIRYDLMVTYSLIILVPFLALSTYFIVTESKKINERTFAALRQNCISLNESMEREIRQMNIVSLNIVYSQLIKDIFGEYLSDQANYGNLKSLNELLANSIGPNRLVDQANLYSIDGTVISSGLNNNTYAYPAEEMSWYDAANKMDGSRVLSYEGLDPYISKYTTDAYGKIFISLSRKYYDKYNNMLGYIEVKKSVKQVLSQAISYKSVVGEHVLLFDGFGKLIYSSNQDNSLLLSLYDQIISQDSSNEFIKLSYRNSDYYVTFKTSDDGVITAIVIDENSLFMPTRSYIRSVLVLAIISLALALLLSYFAANRITVPIQQIYHQMKHVNLDGYSVKKDLNTNTIELNMLNDRFNDMQHKLVDGLNKQLLLKNQEMQAKMLALQSQMNPHFLYNSIATIQSMADENMNQEIIIMCQSMSKILRYISSDTETTVPLQDEISNTVDFLTCMTKRFDEELFYSVDIPDKMKNIKVPKLCIQPLVENSIRFCSKQPPPWKICITGVIDDENYYITVSDNGPGFTKKSLFDIQEKIKDIDETGLLPSLEINGMGLLNVYMRFKILFGSRHIFSINNLEEGGATVAIGGSCEDLMK